MLGSALWARVLWIYAIYQLLTKALVGLILMPLLGLLMQVMMGLSGRSNISSGDYIGFFMSLYGLPVIILGLVVLIGVLAIDINVFILLSSLIQERKLGGKFRALLRAALGSVKHFFSPIGVLITLFVALVFPLLGLTMSLGPLKNFAIPNFISSVIYNTPLYMAIYAIALGLLALLSMLHIFTLHFVLIEQERVGVALKSSRQFIRRHLRGLLKDAVIMGLRILGIVLAIFVLVSLLMLIIALVARGFIAHTDVLVIFVSFGLLELGALFAFMSLPITVQVLTALYYRYRAVEGVQLINPVGADLAPEAPEYLERKLKGIVRIFVGIAVLLVLAVNLVAAILINSNFKELFPVAHRIEIVAHRGGGDLGAENTVEGILAAARAGARWTEIDVQRTRDGAYIINHDKNFARVAGESRKPGDMSLAEIKQLKVVNEFDLSSPSQEVPTLQEVLDAAKGRIGVFVELKGASADPQMVDEVVAMIKARGMSKECVILSLDYAIIEYTEAHYPEMLSGFLYFFSAGKLENLVGDYLLMEEREASADNIDAIHEAGKRAVVWTVNTEESIKTFINSDVDGIITDYVTRVGDAIKENDKRSQLEVILDELFAR